MQQMYSLITPYKCKYCDQDMLFFLTKKNTVIDYRAYLKNANTLSETIEDLSKRKIRYIKCICCGNVSIIDWSNGWPEQLTDVEKLKAFGV